MPMPKQQDGIPFQRANPVMKRSEANRVCLVAYNFISKKMCSMAVMFGSEILEVSSNLILDFIF